MNRTETTKFLTDLLIRDRLTDRKYYAKEVTLDYGTIHPKRIDVMQFVPQGVVYASDIEKGIFICYEIKSCIEDVYSGNGLNFYGEENYIVTTMDTYKKLQDDLRTGKLEKHICDTMKSERCPYFGVLVPIPAHIDQRKQIDVLSEYENPTKLTPDGNFRLCRILPQPREWYRSRSNTELLFCMLRAKHNDTNNR